MATIFSDLFNSAGTVGPGEGALTEELALDATQIAPAGKAGSRLRHTVARVTVGTVAGIGDEIRLLSLPGSVRLHSLQLTSNGGATAGDADLGLYEAGDAHDGAVVDDDLFSTTAVDTDTAQVKVEYILDGALTANDIGKRLWEQAAVGAAAYTVDPQLTFDIVLTVTVAFTVAVTELCVEAWYTSD